MKRDNFYNQSIFPKDSPGVLPDEFFWPTDEEFELIFNVMLSEEYAQFRRDIHDELGVKRELEHFENEDRYAWLAKELKLLKPDYETPLTSQIVLKALKKFEKEIVAKWLS